jgi:hypothetical protein
MNVEIGTEAAQFPEKEYINGIFLAVWQNGKCNRSSEGNTKRNPKTSKGLSLELELFIVVKKFEFYLVSQCL